MLVNLIERFPHGVPRLHCGLFVPFANTPGEGQYHIRMRADVNNRDGGRLPTTYTKRVFSVLRRATSIA